MNYFELRSLINGYGKILRKKSDTIVDTPGVRALCSDSSMVRLITPQAMRGPALLLNKSELN